MRWAPAFIQSPMPDSAMSSAMTWTAQLPTLAEREHFWRVLCSLDFLSTPPASWFSGIALHASLGLCGLHQLIRSYVEAPYPIPAGSLKDSTMATNAAAEQQALQEAAR